MAQRIQSPSSINLYKQCPRRYYYQYIMKLPIKTNIHLIRGNAVHEALEKFFGMDVTILEKESYKRQLAHYLKELFLGCWNKRKKELAKLSNTEFYFMESNAMLANWLNSFFKEFDKHLETKTLVEAFKASTPTEIETAYISQEHKVRGYIDYVQKDGDDIIVMDYKTSKKSEVTPAYRLQLAIYALLYQEKHNIIPKVGIWFLKDKPIIIQADEELVKTAKFELEQIHASTESDHIKDYSKKESGLCKYRTGQCDFYDICRGG